LKKHKITQKLRSDILGNKYPCFENEFIDLDQVADNYAKFTHLKYVAYFGEKAQQHEWACNIFDDLNDAEGSEIAWALIALIEGKLEHIDQFFFFAAGPLEDLIADFGPQFIDRIETRWRQSKRFRVLIAGVWPQGKSHTEIWARIEKLQELGPNDETGYDIN
jgi:hypothetical protein